VEDDLLVDHMPEGGGERTAACCRGAARPGLLTAEHPRASVQVEAFRLISVVREHRHCVRGGAEEDGSQRALNIEAHRVPLARAG